MHASTVAAEPAAWQEYTGQTPAGNLGKCGQPAERSVELPVFLRLASKCLRASWLSRASANHSLQGSSLPWNCRIALRRTVRPAKIKLAPALAPRCPRP